MSSKQSGMGKTLFIQRMAEQLMTINTDPEDVPHLVTVPIHGPVATPDIVLPFLKSHYKDKKSKIYHIDIAPSVSNTRFKIILS